MENTKGFGEIVKKVQNGKKTMEILQQNTIQQIQNLTTTIQEHLKISEENLIEQIKKEKKILIDTLQEKERIKSEETNQEHKILMYLIISIGLILSIVLNIILYSNQYPNLTTIRDKSGLYILLNQSQVIQTDTAIYYKIKE